MKALDIHEAADLLRARLERLPGLKASVALIMWRGLLWALGELYPRFVIADTADGAVETGGVPVGRRPDVEPRGENDLG